MDISRNCWRNKVDTAQANEVMQEANHILEDLPVGKFAFYLLVFAVEIALCFGIALNIR